MTRPPLEQLRPTWAEIDREMKRRRHARQHRWLNGAAFALLGFALGFAAGLTAARAEPVAGPITVLDGDTVRLAGGEVVRLYDIDAPETRPCTAALTRSCARCEREAEMGRAAAAALAAALRAGPVTLERCEPAKRQGAPPRCKDHYGRTLGRLIVAGRSAGEPLIAAGLATRWPERRDWCGRAAA